MVTEGKQGRLIAIDWLRGAVMMLMALDHASAFYNPGRLALDSAATYSSATFLAFDQFMTRWVTHICAPTFVFLTGTCLALSCRRRQLQGATEHAIDRDIVIRGLLIAALDLVLVSRLGFNGFLLQVLYAIGISMMALAWLRKLNPGALFIAALLWCLFGEVVTCVWWNPHQGNPPLWLALTMAPFYSQRFTVLYPVVPWLAIMLWGWVFGCYLIRRLQQDSSMIGVARRLVAIGLLLFAVYAIIRGLNGYGNMLLLRTDATLIQWLHVSKYPPSLSYVCLELGLMALLLAALLQVAELVEASTYNPFLVFGQTALFFYICHLFVLGAPALLFDLAGNGNLAFAYYASLAGLVVLYPICLGYRRYKGARPNSWVRFI